MKIYDKKLAYPYFVWMVLFTVVPLFIVVYYAMTDAEGNFMPPGRFHQIHDENPVLRQIPPAG